MGGTVVNGTASFGFFWGSLSGVAVVCTAECVALETVKCDLVLPGVLTGGAGGAAGGVVVCECVCM